MILRKGSFKEAGINPSGIERIEEMVKDLIKAGKTQAFALLIARNGVIPLYKAFGSHSPGRDSEPLRTSAIFPLASVTKTVTATAAMMLYEQGRLDINSPVCLYVPEFMGKGKEKVLVHQLMTHTSGIRDEDIWKYFEENKDSIPKTEPAENQHPVVLNNLLPGYYTPLWKEPGKEMSYCSFGIELLGDIIRRVSGQSYESFLKEKLFVPLGMKNSYLTVPESVGDRVVRRGEIPGGFGTFTDPVSLETPFAAYGMYSTVYDMSIFLQMFLNMGVYDNKTILSSESVKEMTSNQIPGLSAWFFEEYFEEAGWGYCWDIPFGKKTMGERISPLAFCHSGGSGVMMLADPQYSLICTVFTVQGPEMKMGPGAEPPENLISDMVIEAIEA